MPSLISGDARYRKFFLGAIIIMSAGIGSILASNVAIGPAKKTVEYGQGIYQIAACDSYVRLNLISGATHEFGAPEGLSPLTGISISSLDTKACANTTFTIKSVDLDGHNLSLYRTDGIVAMCADTPCKVGTNSSDAITLSISSKGSVTIDGSSDFVSLAFNRQSGVYSIHFTQPGSLANDVNRLNVQSSNA
jgi:hypothetical protein